MTYFAIALRRCLRTVYFPVLLCVLAAALCVVPHIGREERIPPAGFCDLDGSEVTERISAMLIQNGFVPYSDEEALRADVASGALDCGAVLPPDFETLVRRNQVEEAVVLYTSPVSHAPEMHRNHLAAAVFSELAPYLSAAAFAEVGVAEVGVAEEAVVARYRELVEGGLMFSFRLEDVDGASLSEDAGALAYTIGAASLLIFAIMMHGACRIAESDVAALAMRIGGRQTVLGTVLPRLLLNAGGVVTAVGLAAWLSGEPILRALLPAIVWYTLLLCLLGLLICLLFVRIRRVYGGGVRIVTLYMLLAAPVLCPILYDAAVIFPWIGILRLLCPPYWLWLVF